MFIFSLYWLLFCTARFFGRRDLTDVKNEDHKTTRILRILFVCELNTQPHLLIKGSSVPGFNKEADVLQRTLAQSRQRCCHTGSDESDCTLSRVDSVQISFRSDTESCSHRLAGGFQNLDGPLSLFHMLKVLQQNNKSTSCKLSF